MSRRNRHGRYHDGFNDLQRAMGDSGRDRKAERDTALDEAEYTAEIKQLSDLELLMKEVDNFNGMVANRNELIAIHEAKIESLKRQVRHLIVAAFVSSATFCAIGYVARILSE